MKASKQITVRKAKTNQVAPTKTPTPSAVQEATDGENAFAPPDVARVISQLQRIGSDNQRRQLFSSLQRAYGNTYAGQLATNYSRASHLQRHADHHHTEENTDNIQRHPEGAGLSIDPAAANAEIQNPPPLPGSTSTAAPAGSSGSPSAATTVATVRPPKPGKMPTLTLASSQQILQQAFGSIKNIVQGSIVILNNQAACWAKYDEVNKGRLNPHTNKPWRNGDAKKYIPGLAGFADSGTVYIDKQTDLTSATVHEMLHNNTAGGFRGTVGETINEGMTETLALKALAAAGVTPTASVEAYPTQRKFVAKFAKIVGMGTLTTAYFSGAGSVVEIYETLQGVGEFAKLRAAMEALDEAKVDNLTKPLSDDDKAKKIQGLLVGESPSAEALKKVGLIYNSEGTNQAAVAATITPRIIEIINAAIDKWFAGGGNLDTIEQLTPFGVKDRIDQTVTERFKAKIEELLTGNSLSSEAAKKIELVYSSKGVNQASVAAAITPRLITMINAILDKWYIRDKDLDAIEQLTKVGTKDQISAAITPRIKELHSKRQRNRLQAILT